MSLFTAISVSASGMDAQRTRAELITENLANAETTRTPDGGRIRLNIRSTILFCWSSTIGRQQVPQIAATMSPISRTRSIGVFAIALSNPSSSVKTARINSNDNPATATAFARPVTMVRAAFTLVGPDPGQ